MVEGEIIGSGNLSANDDAMTRNFTGSEKEVAPEQPRSQVDLVFEDLRERYTGREQHEKSGVLRDIQTLLSADKSDVFDKMDPRYPDEAGKKRLRELSNMEITVETMLRREPIDDDLYRDLGTYLFKKYKEDKEVGGETQEALKKFLEQIPSQFLPEEYQAAEKKEPTTEDADHEQKPERKQEEIRAEAAAEQATNVKTLKELLQPLEAFKNFNPENANKKLKEMRGEFKFKDIEKYYAAFRRDVEAVKAAAIAAQPQLAKYQPALREARRHYEVDRVMHTPIVITMRPEDGINVQSYDGSPLPVEEGTERFVVTPDDEVFDSFLAFDHFDTVTEDALKGLDKVKRNVPMPKRELDSLYEVPIMHMRYLEMRKQQGTEVKGEAKLKKDGPTLFQIQEAIIETRPPYFEE